MSRRATGTVSALSDDEQSDPGPVSEISPLEFPQLAALLAEPGRHDLREEISRFIGRGYHRRAPRLQIKILGRLNYAGYDEVVLVTDVSSTGARLWVQMSKPIDLGHASEMSLSVGTDPHRHELSVALARIVGVVDNCLDLAVRFIGEEEQAKGLIAYFLGQSAADD